MKKVFGIILILFGFTYVFLHLTKNSLEISDLSSQLEPGAILADAINKDLIELKKKGELPEQWNSLSSVTVNIDHIKSIDIKSSLGINTNPKGKFNLECTFFNEDPAAGKGRYLVKFSIYDQSQNELWEKFRLYNRPQ